MPTLHLRIITPLKIVLESEVRWVTVPAFDGEITILPRHTKLFTLLKEGVVKIKDGVKEELLAIGGGYIETDGQNLNILVSQAYGQAEIDEKQTQEAIRAAQKILINTKDEKARTEATALLRRSTIDMKLIKHRRQRTI